MAERITIKYTKDNATVYNDGVLVQSFNVFAEDYAHTLAQSLAEKLRRELTANTTTDQVRVIESVLKGCGL